MKPYAALINQAPENLQTLVSHSSLTKTKITLLRSQSAYAKNFKPQIFQSRRCLFSNPPSIAIGRQAFSSNAVPDNLTNAATWTELLGKSNHASIDATTDFGEKAKETYEALMPHLQLLFHSNTSLQEAVVPVCGTLLGTLIAWFAIPGLFGKLYKYVCWNPALAILGETAEIHIPYESSMWNALEDPVKYLVVFMAFSQIGPIVAPGISAYLPQLWRGALVLTLVWFLQRWKNNSFSIAVANETNLGLDRDKLSFLENVSSLGIGLIAVIGLSEAFDIGVQSILTFSGVGGVATAYGAKDMLSNMLSGLFLQFTKPFSIGDNIKAGSIEGEVTEIGLTTTSLLDAEEFPVVVPNSVFSSQMIVNKSRAQWHSSVIKTPIKIEDIEKIPLISEEIKEVLKSNPKVFLGRDAPFCYLSRLEGSSGELTISCSLKAMKKDELLAAEQEILIQAVKTIRRNGADI
ncbi:Mechanosensitive ion channel protein [Rhynchospora pubera]|uniref:Mechanosensitive ion channel protein n=1 Tax=Rhynchospora pubera TaxID=906938 RepID=A0AAV8DVK3_9POAL|nr:Mechanosensitive ion channel protein [Rhynchospora pubera]